MSIGKLIKTYLVENDISQVWLSAETKISTSKLNASLNDKRNLNAEEFAKIVNVLNLDANKFLKDSQPNT